MSNVLEQLQMAGNWVPTAALFNASTCLDKDDFNSELQGLERAGSIHRRSGERSVEWALVGVADDAAPRPEAKAPAAPPSAPVHNGHNGMKPLLESPRSLARKTEFAAPAERIAPAQPPVVQEPRMPPPKTPSKSRKAGTSPDQAQVLGLLRQSAWSLPELAKAVGMSKSGMYSYLKKLLAEKLVKTEGSGRNTRWLVAGTGKPGAIAAVDGIRKNRKSRAPDTVTEALDQLAARLARPAIDRLDLKLEVLDRLGALVEPTIAAVLGEIRADLSPSA